MPIGPSTLVRARAAQERIALRPSSVTSISRLTAPVSESRPLNVAPAVPQLPVQLNPVPLPVLKVEEPVSTARA